MALELTDYIPKNWHSYVFTGVCVYVCASARLWKNYLPNLLQIWCKGRTRAKEQFIKFAAYPVKACRSREFFITPIWNILGVAISYIVIHHVPACLDYIVSPKIAHVGGDLCSLSALVSNAKLFVLYCDLRRLHECYLLLILVSCTNSKGKAWTVLMSKVCDKTDKDTVTVFELYIEFKGTLPA